MIALLSIARRPPSISLIAVTCALKPSPGTPSVANHLSRTARSRSRRKLTRTLGALMTRTYPKILLRTWHALPAHDGSRPRPAGRPPLLLRGTGPERDPAAR